MTDDILMIPYTLGSHIMASLQLAEILKEKYTIHYAVPQQFDSIVKNHHSHVLSGFPFGYNFEETNRKQFENSKDWFLDGLTDRITERIYFDRKKRLVEIIEQVKPKIIFIEMFNSSDFIILYQYAKRNQVKILFYQTVLETQKSPKNLPMDSILLPNNDSLIYREWQLRYFRLMFGQLVQKIRYIGFDGKSQIARRFKKNQISKSYQVRKDNYYHFVFGTQPLLIIAPKELEFSQTSYFQNHIYTGLFNKNNAHGVGSNDFEACWKKVIADKQQRKIIYCGFGTMYEQHQETVKVLIIKLKELFSQHQDYLFIVSIQTHFIGGLQFGDNVYTFDQVPQVKVLHQADLFITHGGLGSIKESILTETPMLVLPLTYTIDCGGNGSKVTYHKIGLRSNIEHDSVQVLSDKVNEVLSNPIYKNNILSMKKQIANNYEYSPENIIQFIENVDFLN